MKIGIFGGTFDPPHIDHQKAVDWMLPQVDELWVVPCWHNAFKDDISDFNHRYNMCYLAFNKKKVIIDNIEERLKTKYTVDLLRYYKKVYPEVEFYLFIGSDQIASLDKWKDVEELKSMCNIVEILREQNNASSTYIRYDVERAVHLLKPEVYKYIKDNNLYD